MMVHLYSIECAIPNRTTFIECAKFRFECKSNLILKGNKIYTIE